MVDTQIEDICYSQNDILQELCPEVSQTDYMAGFSKIVPFSQVPPFFQAPSWRDPPYSKED